MFINTCEILNVLINLLIVITVVLRVPLFGQNTKYKRIKFVQANLAKSLRTWSEISVDSPTIFLSTSCRLLIRLKIQEQLCIPWIPVSDSAQPISVLLYLYHFSRELSSWAIGSGRRSSDFGVMYQGLNNAGIILAWQLCRVDFWNKQKYLSLYDFQTFALIVKQYFFSFSFPLRPCRKKNCCIFCQQKWKRNVNFRGRGNSQAQTRSWSLHNVSWLIFLCHHSAHPAVKNRQLKQWKGAVELQLWGRD